MRDLEGLRKELQRGVISCISGYVGFITHPQRERLTKDVCQRIADIINEKGKNDE
jgi:hypothetical protein